MQTPFVAHPLYRRWGIWDAEPPRWMRAERISRIRQVMSRYDRPIYLGIGFALVLLILLTNLQVFLMIAIVLPIALMLATLPIVILLSGSTYGLASSLLIGTTVVHEKSQGRYDLLGLTPYGFEGAMWALCSLTIQANHFLRTLRYYLQGIYWMLLSLVIIPLILLGSYFLISWRADLYPTVEFLLLSLLVVLGILVDFMQSAIIGSLLGMIASTYAQTQSQLRNTVLLSFPMVQIASYLLVSICVLGIYAPVLNSLDLQSWLLFGTMSLLTFYLVREVLVVGLWVLLTERLIADLEDMDRYTHVGLGKYSAYRAFFNLFVKIFNSRVT